MLPSLRDVCGTARPKLSLAHLALRSSSFCCCCCYPTCTHPRLRLSHPRRQAAPAPRCWLSFLLWEGACWAGPATKSQADLSVGILNSESVQDELVQKFHLDDVFHEKKPSLLRKQLAAESRFEIDPKSSIITIKVTDKLAKRAQALASGYLNALRDTNSRMALLDSSQRRLFYSQQLASEKDALASAEVALKQVEEQSGLIAPVGQTAGTYSS